MASSRPSDLAKILTARQLPGRQRFFRVLLGRSLSWSSSRDLLLQLFVLGVACLFMVFLTSPDPISYKVGKVAESTIRSDNNYRVVDKITTEMLQHEVAGRVGPVFVLDEELSRLQEEAAMDIFQRGRELLSLFPGGNYEEGPAAEDFHKLELDFHKTFATTPDSGIWETLVGYKFSLRLERQVLSLASEIMGLGLLDRPNPFLGQPHIPATIINTSTRLEYTVPTALSLWDIESATRFMELRSKRLRAQWNPPEIKLIVALARALVQPNLKPDIQETDRRMAEARNEAPQAFFHIRPGEVIVREGTLITPEVMEKLETMGASPGGTDRSLRTFGFFLILFVFFTTGLTLSVNLGHNLTDKTLQPLPLREQIFIALLLILTALMAHWAYIFGANLAWSFDYLDQRTIFYAMPVSVASILAAIFFGARRATYMVVFVGAVVAVVSPPGTRFLALVYCCNGSIAAIWCLRNMNQRGQLIPAAFWMVLVNCLTMVGLTFYSDLQWDRQVAYNFGAAAAAGVLSAVIASGLTPLIESVFGFNTNFKMLELGNLDRPILRELMLSAPGTYHHSVIVGAMVEAAAEVIGANPHLAKVGAYYHDIGKLKTPHYFVENQAEENRHDTLAPSMSALILIGHVREGVELARNHRLPKGLVEIIEQHHGTSLISYFYHKANEQRQEGQPEVNQGDYRYPGPRPQSKEAGLVMLADICEAATRSLSEPTPVKINNMVRQLINKVFSDGQLDDCYLRTREIAMISDSFTTILTGIYHRRVAYPGVSQPKEGQSG